MSGEVMGPQGQQLLQVGFKDGAQDRSPVGTKPPELVNVVDPEKRQKVFYTSMAALGNSQSLAMQGYWLGTGIINTVQAEFQQAISIHRTDITATGIDPDELRSQYDERIVAFGACMSNSQLLRGADGSLVGIDPFIPRPDFMASFGWNEDRSAMVRDDPAIAFPLSWLRAYATDGYLFDVMRRKSDGAVDRLQTWMKDQMVASPEWDAYRKANRITGGVEDSLINIAFNYWLLEELPAWQARIDDGYVFPDAMRGTGINANVDRGGKPRQGYLWFDEVWYHNLGEPTGVLTAKGVFIHSEILPVLDNALKFNGAGFKGMGREIVPSKYNEKDIARWLGMWDALVGGSQGTNLADFSKFVDGVGKMANFFNVKDFLTDTHYNSLTDQQRAQLKGDYLGWVVGEIVYCKVMSTVGRINPDSPMESLSKKLSLLTGSPKLTAEMDKLGQVLLGADKSGVEGLLATAANQYGLNMLSPHYETAIQILRTGLRDPKEAQKLYAAGRAAKLGSILLGAAMGADKNKRR